LRRRSHTCSFPPFTLPQCVYMWCSWSGQHASSSLSSVKQACFSTKYSCYFGSRVYTFNLYCAHNGHISHQSVCVWFCRLFCCHLGILIPRKVHVQLKNTPTCLARRLVLYCFAILNKNWLIFGSFFVIFARYNDLRVLDSSIYTVITTRSPKYKHTSVSKLQVQVHGNFFPR
jgi:hypothetical protein